MEILRTSDFDYHLPEELIAQTLAEPRDSSRLLVYHGEGDRVEHAHFYDLPNFLEKGDLLVINNTRVIPARLFGHIDGKETAFEILLLKRLDYTRWEALMRPARKARTGSVIKISDELSAVVESVAETILYAALFLVSFVVLMILLKLLTHALDLVLKLPGLHLLNALGGALVGFVEGALLLFLAVWLLRRFGVSFETETVSATHILRFFTTHTPLSALLSFLQ